MDIFKNKSYWKNLSTNELSIYIEEIFNYYRLTGFPYYPTDDKIRLKNYNLLKNYNRDNIINNDIIKQTMHGLSICWSYFPHSFKVKSRNKLSPYEAFMDDEIFKKVIIKRLKMGDNISDSGIRKMLKIYSGVQGVSNFRPTAAAGIYDIYCNSGVTWDMSGGWGGRLIGANVSNVKKYIATEPSSLTYMGLIEMSKDFSNDFIEYEIIKIGSENYLPDKNSIDLCFTSPPYFNIEKYSNEQSQSYIKFNTLDKWLNGYIKQTINNCYYGLRKNGKLIINISNINSKINIENEIFNIIINNGFKYLKTLKLTLSNINFHNKKKFKYEPIFIFKKN
jgi:hypothetical protein